MIVKDLSMTDISGTPPPPPSWYWWTLITLAEKRGFKEMEEDGLPQPPPGAGAGLVVSLLPKPDIYLEQETRVHETESSWGWTYGNENANNCCCFFLLLFEFESIICRRPWEPEWQQLHATDNLQTLHNGYCPLTPWGKWSGVHNQAVGRQVLDFSI